MQELGLAAAVMPVIELDRKLHLQLALAPEWELAYVFV